VHSITGARRGVSDDVSSRTRRYLISMGIRTVCVILAVVVSGWARWVFIVGAVVLPYISVVLANGGRERIESPPVAHPYAQRPELDAGPAAPPSGGQAPADT